MYLSIYKNDTDPVDPTPILKMTALRQLPIYQYKQQRLYLTFKCVCILFFFFFFFISIIFKNKLYIIY